jgi:small-conductance mechanosensitive channel
VGDKVRLQGGQIAGQIEGVVSSLGLLYTTLATDEGLVLVPNGVVLGVAIVTQRAGPAAQRPGPSGPADTTPQRAGSGGAPRTP